ncbi:MAG: UPF0149 family protein [Chlorobium sp.]|nr:MAG: UPF0149 family protein [Chlorobium sp.]
MNTSTSLQSPLSVEESALLRSFLLSDVRPEESFSSIEMLDGYLTALTVGPEVIEPDIWIPYIWNQQKSEEPCFSSAEEATVIGELLVRYMHTTEQQFHGDPDGFKPLFERVKYSNKQQKEQAIEDWSLGFTMGIELNHESWKPLFTNEETGMLGMPMLILSKVTDDYKALKKEEVSDMVSLLPDFVVKIYHYWKQHKG